MTRGPARVDTALIARRLREPVGVRHTKGALFMALNRTRDDCAALLLEVTRLRNDICNLSIAFTKRLEELERQHRQHQPEQTRETSP